MYPQDRHLLPETVKTRWTDAGRQQPLCFRHQFIRAAVDFGATAVRSNMDTPSQMKDSGNARSVEK